MKNILKWLFIAGCVLGVFIIAAAFIIPRFVDIQKYKPVIEQKVTQATGRSFTLGGDMDVSVFPWIGAKLTDLHLGNPEGYAEKDMISIKNFEVRLKVLPLLSKKIEVKTFVLDTPKIYLEKQKPNTANWQGIGSQKETKKAEEKKSKTPDKDQAIPIQSLQVGNFSITNGQLLYVDKTTNVKKEISDLNLRLSNISFDNPVNISFGANVDGQPISLEGKAGPIGREPGKGTIGLEFVLKALGALEAKLDGNIVNPAGNLSMDLNVDVASFSPKKLMKTLDQKFPIQSKDPSVLESVSLKTKIKGTPDNVSFSDGLLKVDDSNLKFTAAAKEFNKPNLKFDLQLDGIDLDRYLPESKKEDQQSGEKTKTKPPVTEKKTDYSLLRKLVLDGKIKAGKVKASGATVENMVVHILAKNGIISIDPFGLDLYSGNVESTLTINVQDKAPKTGIVLTAKGIQAGPLIKDTTQKEIIEGTLTSDIQLSMAGETPEMIRQTLTGKGELLFNDGAVIGIDIADTVRNVKSKLGGQEKPKEKPKTDFAELKIPFTAKNGLVNTKGSSLVSPLIRVVTTGDINLVKELLDLRVDPKFVATLKGQGDTKERSGVMVPVLVTGTFASPKIRPDLKGMLGVDGKAVDTKALKEKVLGSETEQKEKVESIKEDAGKKIKGLFKGFSD